MSQAPVRIDAHVDIAKSSSLPSWAHGVTSCTSARLPSALPPGDYVLVACADRRDVRWFLCTPRLQVIAVATWAIDPFAPGESAQGCTNRMEQITAANVRWLVEQAERKLRDDIDAMKALMGDDEEQE